MHLIVTVPGQPSRIVPLVESARVRLGRSPECDVQLGDSSVSRVHVELRFETADNVSMRDPGSRFGTFVNGQKTTECTLRPGDILLLGESTVKVEDNVLEETVIGTLPHESQGEFDAGQLIRRRFGRFEAMSIVTRSNEFVLLKAIDTVSQADIALKVFSPQFTNHASISRLTRAAALIVPLTHEHLQQVYDTGIEQGLCWVASEFVAGETALEVIHRIGIAGMLDWRHSLKTSLHLARALAYLGEHQIVHRNISPQSILFCRPSGIVKLSDLVLAKSLEDQAAAAVTTAGEIVGSLPYCSPEQVSGGTIDVRSDLYNLGATIYALLTGRPPCEGTDIVQTLHKIRTETPRRPTETHLSVPQLYEGIVLKLLAKRPEDRFKDAAHLVKELQRAAAYLGES